MGLLLDCHQFEPAREWAGGCLIQNRPLCQAVRKWLVEFLLLCLKSGLCVVQPLRRSFIKLFLFANLYKVKESDNDRAFLSLNLQWSTFKFTRFALNAVWMPIIEIIVKFCNFILT